MEEERESEKHYKGEGRRGREGLGQGRAGLADFVRSLYLCSVSRRLDTRLRPGAGARPQQCVSAEQWSSPGIISSPHHRLLTLTHSQTYFISVSSPGPGPGSSHPPSRSRGLFSQATVAGP